MSKEGYHVAILGATGSVGEALREILEEREFPVRKISLLASSRSVGTPLLFKKRPVLVEDVATFDFSGVDIGLFSAGGSVSREYGPKAAAAGCVVIDNTSEFRYEPDVPLIIPEVNSHALEGFRLRNIIANPNCSTIQMLVALKPIYDAVGITRINVATYQSVSGAGFKGVKELAGETGRLLNGLPVEPKHFPAQIAFNVIPQIDVFQENGYTREEMKMFWETQKIFGDNDIKVNATAVRVPVFYGHSEAINIETEQKITVELAHNLLRNAPGVILMDGLGEEVYPMPVPQAAGHDGVYVGRVREDISHPLGLNLWVVSDNVRKGAALNAIQIAEELIKSDWI